MRSELKYPELWDELEVPHIVGRNLEAEFKSSDANQQMPGILPFSLRSNGGGRIQG